MISTTSSGWRRAIVSMSCAMKKNAMNLFDDGDCENDCALLGLLRNLEHNLIPLSKEQHALPPPVVSPGGGTAQSPTEPQGFGPNLSYEIMAAMAGQGNSSSSSADLPCSMMLLQPDPIRPSLSKPMTTSEPLDVVHSFTSKALFQGYHHQRHHNHHHQYVAQQHRQAPQQASSSTFAQSMLQMLVRPLPSAEGGIQTGKAPSKDDTSHPLAQPLQQKRHHNLPSSHDMRAKLQQQRFKRFHEEKWTERLSELLCFRSLHGHCQVPHKYPTNLKLARWVKRQRQQCKLMAEGKTSTMTPERAAVLKEAGFVWDSHQTAWSGRIQDLRDYRSRHRDCNVPSSYDPKPMLGTW